MANSPVTYALTQQMPAKLFESAFLPDALMYSLQMFAAVSLCGLDDLLTAPATAKQQQEAEHALQSAPRYACALRARRLLSCQCCWQYACRLDQVRLSGEMVRDMCIKACRWHAAVCLPGCNTRDPCKRRPAAPVCWTRVVSSQGVSCGAERRCDSSWSHKVGGLEASCAAGLPGQALSCTRTTIEVRCRKEHQSKAKVRDWFCVFST